MPKSVKLKNNSFWIVAAIIIIIGATFYGQTNTEGFEKIYTYAGALVYGNLKDLPDSYFTSTLPGYSIINASNGRVIWKTGRPKPILTNHKYYYLSINGDKSKMTYNEIKFHEKMMKEGEPSPNDEHVCAIFLTSDNKYTDVYGNSLGEYTRFLGMNIFKRTLSLILGSGIIVLFLVIYILIKKYRGGYS